MYTSPPFYSSATFPSSPESFVSPATPPVVEPVVTSTSYLHNTAIKTKSIPVSFYPDFLQYSKETYEQSTGLKYRKRKQDDRDCGNVQKEGILLEPCSSQQAIDAMSEHRDEQWPSPTGIFAASISATTVEMRRQIHIQSEQKRRAQIKDGFEELRNELPACLNKKMSKVALLHRTVQHIQHLKSSQVALMTELERLIHENEQLRQFQQGMLEKHTLDNMYSVSGL